MNIRNLPNSQLQNLLRIQFELYQIEKISSFYTEILTFLVQYSFIFDESPTKIKTLTPDPARDGSNWYGYAGQNPLTQIDPTGLSYYTGTTGASVQSSNTPVTPHDFSETRGSSGGPAGTPKIPEAPEQPETAQANNLSCKLFAAGYNTKGELILLFLFYGKRKSTTVSLKKQAEIEKKYGFDNLLYYVTTTLNMYITDEVVTESFIDNDLGKILDKHLNNDKTSKEYGALDDFNHLSNDMAVALGLDRYYEFIYDGDNP